MREGTAKFLLCCIIVACYPIEAASEAGTRGLEALRNSRPVEAEKLLRAALVEEPDRFEWLKGLGMALAAQEKYRDAEPAFARACVLRPDEADACYYLGRARFTLGRFAEATSAFQQALANAKNTARTLHGMALAHERGGKTKAAEDAYLLALKQGRREAGVDYGLFLANQGRFADAISVLAKSGATAELDRVKRQAEAANKGNASTPPPVAFRFTALPVTLRNGATSKKHLPETMAGGVAILDIENDGLPDIFFANGAMLPNVAKPDASYHDALFRNRGESRFEDVTAKAGLAGAGFNMGAATGDFDGDGFDDLFVPGLRGSLLYRNNGNGSFTDVTRRAGFPEISPWSVSAAWVDFDRDGWLDLFVVRYVNWDPAAEPDCFDAGVKTYCHPSHYQPLANVLYRNKADGTFEDVSAKSGISLHAGKGMGVAVGDINADGWPDLFVANDTLPNFAFVNNKNGTFKEAALDAGVALKDDGRAVSSMGAVFADFDNDGRDELMVSTLSDETFLLFKPLRLGVFEDTRLGSGIANLSQPFTGWGVSAADFNNDGFIDLLVACGHVQDNAEKFTSRSSKQPILLFLNRGNGTFIRQQIGEPDFYRGLAIGDLNGDGLMDAVVTRLNQQPVILWNTTTTEGRHWIGFHLSGRPVVGARITVETQHRRLTPNYGYASSHQPLVHFGLGRTERLQSVTVEWPDGTSRKLSGLAVDRVHKLSRQ